MNKKSISSKSIFVILAVIYILITVLAIISLMSAMNEVTTISLMKFSDKVVFVLKEIWWPLTIIIIFIIIYVLYNSKDEKKIKLAAILQFFTGASMLINSVINMVRNTGENYIMALSFIYPILFMLFSVRVFANKNIKETPKDKANKK